MKLNEEIEFIEKAIFLPKYKTIIIADLHIGYEEAVSNMFNIPLKEFDKIFEEIKLITKKLKPERIIINGDIKHEFGKINKEEWNRVLELLEFLKEEVKEIVIIEGNHDKVLKKIIRKVKEIKFENKYIIGNILIAHGDKIVSIDKTQENRGFSRPRKQKFSREIKTIIIGHEHPAVSIGNGIDKEKFKCFLVGNFKGKELIVMPSFFSINEGTDLTREKTISPFLKNISNFDVYVVEDKIYHLGKIKNL